MAVSKKIRVHVFRCLVAVMSCIFALLLAEVACRMFFPPEPCLRFQQDVDLLKEMKLYEATSMIQNDPELFWRLAPNTRLPDESWPFFGVISNGQSLREDHEIDIEKPEEQIRILFLGDSCTFGFGVAQKETFVEVAESLMRERCGRPVECINAGVPGYTIFQGYRYILTEGLRYQPDLVVLNFGLNDSSIWDHRGDIEHYAAWKDMQPPAPLKDIRICRLIWARLYNPLASQPQTEERQRLLPEEFVETLKKLHFMLEEKGIPMLVLVWPMQVNTEPGIPHEARTYWQIEMTSFGHAHPVLETPPVSGVLDLVPLGQLLVREHGAQAIYFDQGHVTSAGHLAIGRAVADHLANWLNK